MGATNHDSFSLCGARKIIMTDQNRLCSSSTVASAINSLSRNRELIVSGLGLDRDRVTSLLDCAPLEMDRVFRHFRLEYIAPCGCVRLPVADCSVDLVYSRAVLEHLPPSLIEGAFSNLAAC